MSAPRLTDAQREAVESLGRGDVCVVAGPGSGKTTVLVERVRRLVEREGVGPDEIAAVTFTRKAAQNMRRRLVEDLPVGAARRRHFERVHVSTIHVLCARLLRDHCFEAGLDPEFRLMEQGEAEVELRRSVEAALDEALEDDPDGARAFLRAFEPGSSFTRDGDGSNIHAQVVNLIDSARGWNQRLFSQPADDADRAAREWITAAAQTAWDRFQETKRALRSLDFNDLEAETVRLLERLVDLRLPFRHLLLDENQDTNPLQARLARLLIERCADDQPTLFAVGDINQSIYAFRNADPEVFEKFQSRAGEGGHRVELLDNFRSRAEILAAVHALTDGSAGVSDHRLTARREFPPKKAPCVEVLIARAGDKDEAREREARWIARRILDLRSEITVGDPPRAPQWRDFAVLVRKNNLLDEFAAGLDQFGIPYQQQAGRGFFKTEEVRDLLALMRALDNPADEINLAAVLRSPLVGLNDESLLRLKSGDVRLHLALERGVRLDEEQSARARSFWALAKKLRAERESVPPNVWLSRALAATGYEAWLLGRGGGPRRSANVQKLLRMAARVSEDGRLPFRGTIERLEATAQAGGGEPEATLSEDADAVRLMTIHAAKGLEFPVVVIPAIQSPPSNRGDSLLFDPERGVGAAWGGDRKDDAYKAVSGHAKKLGEAESNRVFYVALTRAEEHLVVSASWGAKPSRAAWAKNLDQWGIDIKSPPDEPRTRTFKGVDCRFHVADSDPEVELLDAVGGGDAGVQLIEPREPGGQADSEAPVTAVALFADCPRRYFLSRYLGLEAAPPRTAVRPEDDDPADEDADGAPDAAELGTQVHALLAGQITADEAAPEARELAARFEGSDLGRRAKTARRDLREHETLFEVGGRLLRGKIDRLIEDDAGRVLIDYKTDAVASDEEIAERVRAYAPQLLLYAAAVDLGSRPGDRAALHFLRPDKVVDVDLSAESLAAARASVEEFFQAQQRLEFPMRAADRCRRCPHFGGPCPAQP